MVETEKDYRSNVPLCELNQEEYPAEHCLTTTTTTATAARQVVGVPPPPPPKTDQQLNGSNANARKQRKLKK